MRIVNHEKRVVVLLVDDSDFHRGVIRELIETHHGIALAAKTHASARELVGQHWGEIDAVILDACVEPPHLAYDANLLLEDLRRLNATRSSPATILGLSGDRELRRKLMRDGCTGTCQKDDELLAFLPEFLSDLYEQYLVTATFKRPAPE